MSAIADLINDLRGEVVKKQHNIHDKPVFWELLEHLSGVGHLEVLGLAKGSAPVKGDYEKWLKTEEGQRAVKATQLNSNMNVLVKAIFNCFSAADKSGATANDQKANGKKALGLVENFEKTNHLWPGYWPKVTEKAKELKKLTG